MTRVATHHMEGNDPTDAEAMDHLFEAHLAAEAAQDLDALLATLAPDAVHEVIGEPTVALSDRDAIANRYRAMFADLHATGTRPIRRLHGPGFLLDECIYEANAVGTPFGVEGHSRPVSMRLLHVLEFRNGLISRETVWADAAAVIAQLSQARH